MKARAVFVKDALRTDGAPKAEHIFVVTDDGRVFEAFSDEPGHWLEIPLPKGNQPKATKLTQRNK